MARTKSASRRPKVRPPVAPQPSPTLASSSSGPVPSHSDSPSPRKATLRGGDMPRHWRKQAAGRLVRVEVRSAVRAEVIVSDELRHEEVRQWLHLALAPHLEFSGADARTPLTRGMDTILDRTIGRVLADRELVQAIWKLKRYHEVR